MMGCLLFPFRLFTAGLRSAVFGIVLLILVGGVIAGVAKWVLSDAIVPDAVEEEEIIQERPSVSTAPYIVQTTSRYYLVPAYTLVDDDIIMHGYWEERGVAGWVWHPDDLLIQRHIYGPWIVIGRAFD